ncbi:MAG: cation-transporting P-type ATPase, partial [Clostridia bacterium]
MKKKKAVVISRIKADPKLGLSSAEVEERRKNKLVNNLKQKNSKSYGKIFFENIFTFFNMIWLIIFLALL